MIGTVKILAAPLKLKPEADIGKGSGRFLPHVDKVGTRGRSGANSN